MPEIVDLIRLDHANMRKLLDVLERQVRIVHAEGTPDYDIILGVLDYCLTYPELFHHPAEDLIYRRLCQVKGTEAVVAEKLETEHAELSTLTRKFATYVGQILQETEMLRETFEDTARSFLDAYRRHMAMEEEDFLPEALATLGSVDWVDIEIQSPRPPDPMFDAEVAQRFELLRRDILNWDRLEPDS